LLSEKERLLDGKSNRWVTEIFIKKKRRVKASQAVEISRAFYMSFTKRL